MTAPEQFDQYIKSVEDDIKMWTDVLVKEALEQGTYKKAITWLGKNKPDLKGKGMGTVEDQLESLYRTAYEDAISKIYKLALDQKVEVTEDGSN